MSVARFKANLGLFLTCLYTYTTTLPKRREKP